MLLWPNDPLWPGNAKQFNNGQAWLSNRINNSSVNTTPPVWVRDFVY